MKYTIVGDPHAKPTNLDKISQLFEKIEELGNPCIILGDLLDTKELVRASCLNKYLDLIGKSSLHFTILVGNHDWFNLECADHSLRPLKLLPNVTLVDRLTVSQEKNLAFMPYMPVQETRKVLTSPELSGKIVFAHLDIQGFDYGNGHLSTEGVDEVDVSGVRAVISGHYHKLQRKGNITYLGTPFSHSFGEANQKKYIGIFDSVDGSLKLIRTNFPEHIVLKVPSVEELKNLSPQLDVLNASSNLTRVDVTRSNEDIPPDYSRWPNIKFLETFESSSSAVSISETLSAEQQFQIWAEEIANLGSETVSLGMEVLKNVQKD